MTTKTEGMHAGEFCGELALGLGYHADKEVLIAGQNLVGGTVIGKITASSKNTILAPAAVDGSQTAAGIIWDNVNAVADTNCLFLRRGPAVVNGNDLTWPGGITGPQKATAIAQLLAIGIKVV